MKKFVLRSFFICGEHFLSYLTPLLFPVLIWHASAGKEPKNSLLFDFSLFEPNAFPGIILKNYYDEIFFIKIQLIKMYAIFCSKIHNNTF
ncbi:hypothetical protein BpHYR1_014920 [Brachionus plicatilis]|uniref:Uncharacterized protein n=1 Tax=Brachionus plicatilis TaxID=10195 RepID=A0A3M7Q746_BRAPC|nr:hypothetical protein BpHYR1_014920 [Brachionus plicatilis]